MSLRIYLTLMILATILCAAVFWVTVTVIDPFTTNWLGFALFYASLFLAVLGVAAIIGFVVRFVLLRQRLALRAVIISFRQALLVALLAVVTLMLLAHKLFSWLNVIFLIIGFSALEFFLLSVSSEDR
jgi:hypothetical protein